MTKQLAILGGGQLAQMIARAAKAIDIQPRCFDPNPKACARTEAPVTHAPFEDHDALKRWAEGADAITCEWESVPIASLEALLQVAPVRPSPESFRTGSDRLLEKQLFKRSAIKTPEFERVDDAASLKAAIKTIGTPGVLKRRSGGYDGRGQVFIDTAEHAGDAWAALGRAPCIYEQRVPFTRELSVVVARSAVGTTAAYPVVENRHAAGILVRTTSPAPNLDPAIATDIQERVLAMAEHLNHVGVMAVELFEVTAAGTTTLMGNETAPRVHNSGHWTQDATTVCQFENHARAVLADSSLDIITPEITSPAVMLNIIGHEPDFEALAALEGVHPHRYAKEPRMGRKLGHVNITEHSLDAAIARADAFTDLVRPSP